MQTTTTNRIFFKILPRLKKMLVIPENYSIEEIELL